MNSHTPRRPRLLNGKNFHLIEINIWPQKQSSMKFLKLSGFRLMSSHKVKVNKIKSYLTIFKCNYID